jgi:hypothetical protein
MDLFNNSPWVPLYLIGCAVAFTLSLIILLANMIAGLSIFAKNLRQVGLRISWTTGQTKEIEGQWGDKHPLHFVFKFGLAILVLAIASLQSWLAVVWIPIQYLINFIKSFGVPRDVRDARWRLRNILFDFDGVVRMLAIIAGKPVDREERAQLLESLKERNLITEFEYNRLMKSAETKATA